MKTQHTRVMHDLTEIGLPNLPLLGTYRNLTALEGLDAHRHQGILEICYLIAGRQVYRVDGRDFVLSAGDVFLAFPGEEHSTGPHPQERGSLFWLQVLLPAASRRQSFLGLQPAAARDLVAGLRTLRQRFFHGSDQIREHFHELFAIYEDAGPLRTTIMAAVAIQLLCEVIACEQRQGEALEHGAMNQVLTYIDRHLDKTLSAAELARIAGLSVSWFKARFRSEVGVPPGEYVLRRKIDRARNLLRDRRRTITDIAFSLGFSSSQYFATVFRRYTSTNPRSFRRRLKS